MVNYIHHIEHTMEKFREDERITPWHVSLYFALFQIWNNTRFKDEINIRREELMGLSKIGSANTYTRCLKELNEWGYILYAPSKSRFKSSKVHMYRFDTTPIQHLIHHVIIHLIHHLIIHLYISCDLS
jgi:hypothetical protein